MTLIPSSEAQRIIMSVELMKKKTSINIQECVNKVLAEDIYTDRPFPAFDQVSSATLRLSIFRRL